LTFCCSSCVALCSGHGSPEPGSGACLCQAGWAGQHCNVCKYNSCLHFLRVTYITLSRNVADSERCFGSGFVSMLIRIKFFLLLFLCRALFLHFWIRVRISNADSDPGELNQCESLRFQLKKKFNLPDPLSKPVLWIRIRIGTFLQNPSTTFKY